ncbi:glycerol-3-phosphate 1-O-acyltransferase PlsY [Gimibacter soli]|uniref:Glycerol-3-phosphate acyltransferase n=1 Tax=Gimibacter soli TaxID=3024400 RepID=A0AAE9XSU4_9PROT|nr:glycerol-3-phosphate 1-O-acyltransferase PlsY [Gimibacter soli]WCL55706.1 glycerol-3-phosphate 1-O-acyltransferase PlsY [Gimibacter soli]
MMGVAADFILIFAYMLGSVPFGLVITHLAGLGDIRAIGSGNIGATNVLRTGRKDLALLTLLLDAGKGAIAVGLTAWLVEPGIAPLAGAVAFMGHCFPIYLGFKGGKGVATFFGTLLAISPATMGATALIWVVVAAITRYSSLAALVAAVAAPLLSAYLFPSDKVLLWPFILVMTIVIFIRHKDNIGRLIKGTESRIGKKSEAAPEKPEGE